MKATTVIKVPCVADCSIPEGTKAKVVLNNGGYGYSLVQVIIIL